MPAVVTLVSPSADALRDAVEALRSRLPDVKSVDELGPGAVDLVSAAAPGDLRGEITAARWTTASSPRRTGESTF